MNLQRGPYRRHPPAFMVKLKLSVERNTQAFPVARQCLDSLLTAQALPLCLAPLSLFNRMLRTEITQTGAEQVMGPGGVCP